MNSSRVVGIDASVLIAKLGARSSIVGSGELSFLTGQGVVKYGSIVIKLARGACKVAAGNPRIVCSGSNEDKAIALYSAPVVLSVLGFSSTTSTVTPGLKMGDNVTIPAGFEGLVGGWNSEVCDPVDSGL